MNAPANTFRQNFITASDALRADMADQPEYLANFDQLVDILGDPASRITSVCSTSIIRPNATAQSPAFREYLPQLFRPDQEEHIRGANVYRAALQEFLDAEFMVNDYVADSALKPLPEDVRRAQIEHMININNEDNRHSFRALSGARLPKFTTTEARLPRRRLTAEDQFTVVFVVGGFRAYREFRQTPDSPVQNEFGGEDSPVGQWCATTLQRMYGAAFNEAQSANHWRGQSL
jgi:hypothetical protein